MKEIIYSNKEIYVIYYGKIVNRTKALFKKMGFS